ncbi:MAG TPA: class I SAM-dependent methyltransferase [Anaerolineales bacterium]|nr:class I SAM-dependent methyltransferase [Anaerolineales bacterium]
MILARFLRFAFRLLYHRLAWIYDIVAAAVSAGQWKNWVLSTVPLLPETGRILEVGHGPGHLLEHLLRKGRRIAAVDLSPQMGRRARRMLRAAGLEAPLARANALALPFPPGAFDAVVATFPAEYIAERAAWVSFARVLAPGGRVVVLLGANPLGRGLLRSASRLLFRLTRQEIKVPEDLIRVRFEAALRETGLEVEFRQAEVDRSTVFLLLAKRDGSAERGSAEPSRFAI